MTTAQLTDDLKRDEGLRLEAYPDPRSALAAACILKKLDLSDYRKLDGWERLAGEPWTVGYGCTGAGIGQGTVWTQAQADAELHLRAVHAVALLDQHAPWWRELDDVRQDALANMCFNMGWGDGRRGLSSFHNTLTAIRARAWRTAFRGMLASAWAREVGQRATRLAQMILTGRRP